jgi:hypothetical protein
MLRERIAFHNLDYDLIFTYLDRKHFIGTSADQRIAYRRLAAQHGFTR